MMSSLTEKKRKIGSRYYVYLSDSKVDMLFSQISGRSDVNRCKKADEVIKHIYENENVGTIEAPTEYFHGTLDMKWGPFDEAPLVYFSGYSDDTLVALCGSTKHLIGLDMGRLGRSHALSHSLTPVVHEFFLTKLGLDVPADVQWNIAFIKERFGHLEDNGKLALALDLASSQMYGPTAKLEFLARKLVSLDVRDGLPSYPRFRSLAMVLGTPIYVALAG
jgi:hypothetical protein